MKKLLLLVVGFALLSKTDAWGVTLYLHFWDTNGATYGAGGSQPTGTWGVDAYWSKDDGAGNFGTQDTVPWPAGHFAVFSADDDASGAYTVNVSGTIQVADIHVDLGVVTFDPVPGTGASLQLKDGNDFVENRLLAAGHKDANAVARYNVPLTDAINVFRYKRGTVIFGATNTFTGALTVEGGVLELGAPYVIPAGNMLVLANDDGRGDVAGIGLANNTPATFATGGFSQKLGPLKLAGPVPAVARTIDFGNGASALAFADSSGQKWVSNEGLPIPLHIVNYTPGLDSLRFGTSAAGLSKAQLGMLRFADFADLPGQIDASGYVTPALPVIQSVRRIGP
jgi:autotransporter-associated beta strand protein